MSEKWKCQCGRECLGEERWCAVCGWYRDNRDGVITIQARPPIGHVANTHEPKKPSRMTLRDSKGREETFEDTPEGWCEIIDLIRLGREARIRGLTS